MWAFSKSSSKKCCLKIVLLFLDDPPLKVQKILRKAPKKLRNNKAKTITVSTPRKITAALLAASALTHTLLNVSCSENDRHRLIDLCQLLLYMQLMRSLVALSHCLLNARPLWKKSACARAIEPLPHTVEKKKKRKNIV